MNPDESTDSDVARKQARGVLATSEARMRALLEAAVDAIISIDEPGAIQTINPAAERLFGYAPDEVIGRNVKILMPSPYREEHDGYLARYRATGEKKIIGIGREVLGRRKDGSTFPMDLSVAEARLGDERIFAGIIRDITERKRAEQALRESEERFRGTFENVAVGIAHEDLAGRFLRFNDTFCATLGYSPTELVGRTLSDVTHPEDELLETIYHVMSQPNARAPTTAWPPPAPETATAPLAAPAPLHILVAEDNELSAHVLEQLLTRKGHRVKLTSNGREALALAEEGVFDLLLLDVHMPELDGFQVIRAVRERERTAAGHLPVIALTARARQEDRDRCLASGMDDFLTKPVRTADLWAAIARVQGARRPAARPEPRLLDPRVLLAACGNDAGALEQICQRFWARLPDDLADVWEALGDRDAARLSEAAHKLCGTLALFSTVASAVASALEDQAALGQLEAARPLVERLETMADELMRLAGGMSLETLRHHVHGAGDPDPTAR